jgi:hypothetical protein
VPRGWTGRGRASRWSGLIEAGAWSGGASMMMRATLDTLDACDRTMWVAASFQGFPAPDRQKTLSAADYLAVSLEQVKSNSERFGLEHGVSCRVSTSSSFVTRSSACGASAPPHRSVGLARS